MWRDEVPLPVDDGHVGLHRERLDRPTRGEALRDSHAHLVALLLAGGTHRPTDAPRRDAVEQELAIGLGEQLRVAHAVDALVAG
jgi:hypothetical protein